MCEGGRGGREGGREMEEMKGSMPVPHSSLSRGELYQLPLPVASALSLSTDQLALTHWNAPDQAQPLQNAVFRIQTCSEIMPRLASLSATHRSLAFRLSWVPPLGSARVTLPSLNSLVTSVLG